MCSAKVGRPQASSNHYSVTCTHVAKGLNEKGIRFRAGRAAPLNQAEDEASNFCASYFFPRGSVWISISLVHGLQLLQVVRRAWKFLVTWRESCMILCPVNPFSTITCSKLVVFSSLVRYFCSHDSIMRQMAPRRLSRRLMRFNPQIHQAGGSTLGLCQYLRLNVIINSRCELGPMLPGLLRTICPFKS